MTTRTEQEDRVLALVDAINTILSGVDLAEAHTALTLAVVVGIVSTADAGERKQAAEIFTEQVRAYIARPDIIEWIEHGVISRHGSGGMQ